MIVAAMILGLIAAALAMALYTFSRLNHYQLTTQHCIAAAQAQLDSITATGKPIPDEDFQRLWPKLKISLESTPGTGQWKGMNLAKVTASGRSFSTKVNIQLSRYVRDTQAPEENTENNPPAKEDS
jgi:type II secretory pathway pseudopilin PulG